MHSLVATLACLATFVAVGLAADKCFNCYYYSGLPSSVQGLAGSDDKCDKPDKEAKDQPSTCSNSGKCLKQYYDKDGFKYVYRTCLPSGTECDDYTGSSSLSAFDLGITCCEGDRCNTSNTVRVSLVSVVIAVAFTLFL